jgi:hypothetical protein
VPVEGRELEVGDVAEDRGDDRDLGVPALLDAFAANVATRFGSSTDPARRRMPSTASSGPPRSSSTTASAAT